MKKPKVRKMALRKETLRKLDDDRLKDAAGAATTVICTVTTCYTECLHTCEDSCPTTVCC